MYTTIEQLMQAMGRFELAQLLADEEQLISVELLTDAVIGDSSALDVYSDAERDAVAAALSRVETAITEQSDLMDGYLARRYRLPLTEDELASATQLRSCCNALARMALADDATNSTDRMIAERKYWDGWLKQVAEGKTLLPGITATSAGSGQNQRCHTAQPSSAINWDRY